MSINFGSITIAVILGLLYGITNPYQLPEDFFKYGMIIEKLLNLFIIQAKVFFSMFFLNECHDSLNLLLN